MAVCPTPSKREIDSWGVKLTHSKPCFWQMKEMLSASETPKNWREAQSLQHLRGQMPDSAMGQCFQRGEWPCGWLREGP